MISAPVQVHFNPKLRQIFADDASAYRLGAVILHLMLDGMESPNAFASRTLSPAESHGNADGLSRLSLQEVRIPPLDNASVFDLALMDSLPVQSAELMASTQADPQLKRVLQFVSKRWPKQCPASLCPFWQRRSELTVEGEQIVEKLHQGHP